ncbi:MAG: hypothetical protein ACLFR2_01825 [Candidatus Kapaibacterium sp.]
MTYRLITTLLVLVISASSCIVVKHDEKPDIKPKAVLSPKAEIPMADILVRSEKGDMISQIPVDWFFVNLESQQSADVIAVAVNPEYSLMAVFSKVRTNTHIEEVVNKEGLIGLARLTADRINRKTAGSARMDGRLQKIEMGSRDFARFDITTTGGALKSRNVVFISQLGHYYQFGLLPMDIKGKPIPPDPEIEKIFRSILTTIKFN